MIVKCQKSKKHKPKKVAKVQLKIGGEDSTAFPDTIAFSDYKGDKSTEIRKALRKIVDDSK